MDYNCSKHFRKYVLMLPANLAAGLQLPIFFQTGSYRPAATAKSGCVLFFNASYHHTSMHHQIKHFIFWRKKPSWWLYVRRIYLVYNRCTIMLINAIELSNYWNNLSLICTIMTQSAPKITAAIINRNIAFCTYCKKNITSHRCLFR